MTSLKYFFEEANEYHIIATGSLLGIAVKRGVYSYSVGKIQSIIMYPMDYEEFLLAIETKNSVFIKQMRECYNNNN